ncbi:MAG: hypothetical protein HQK84_08705 [Nitrospinae bacterium]|nr:hypothetical protein [Nitrospinota bacterium]
MLRVIIISLVVFYIGLFIGGSETSISDKVDILKNNWNDRVAIKISTK